jgi:hypothetical protein
MAEVLRQAPWIRVSVVAITIFLAALVSALAVYLHPGMIDSTPQAEFAILGVFCVIVAFFGIACLDTHLYAVTLDTLGITYGGISPRPRFLAREDIASWRRSERVVYGFRIPFVDLYDQSGRHRARISASLDDVNALYRWLAVRAVDETGHVFSDNGAIASGRLDEATAYLWTVAFTCIAIIANCALLLPELINGGEIGRRIEAGGLIVAMATVFTSLAVARRYPDAIRVDAGRDSDLPSVAAPVLLTAGLISVRSLLGHTILEGYDVVIGFGALATMGFLLMAEPCLRHVRARTERALIRALLVVIAFGGAFTGNQALDLDPPTTHRTRVLAKGMTRDSSTTSFHLIVADWRFSGERPLKLNVSPSDYRHAAKSGAVDVDVMTGALQTKWVSGLHFDD